MSITHIHRTDHCLKLASKWEQKHFDKWTGKGCLVTLPLLQDNSIILSSVCVSNKNISKSSKKMSGIVSAGLSRGQTSKIRVEQSQLCMFTFGREEKLVLVLYMYPILGFWDFLCLQDSTLMGTQRTQRSSILIVHALVFPIPMLFQLLRFSEWEKFSLFKALA